MKPFAAFALAGVLVVLCTPALPAGFWTFGWSAQPSAAPLPTITAISVCGAGSTASTSCPDGTFDTQQAVLASHTGGVQLNAWNLANAVDEHSSVFPPNSLNGNPDYLFFVASGTKPMSTSSISGTLVHDPKDIGVVVLSGNVGKDGIWGMTFAPGYGSADEGGNVGQVFMAPTGQDICPIAAAPDHTFDLNYAAPGSIVADPTGPPGSLLMYYEGANNCEAASGTKIFGGIATSNDYGKHWPAYAPTPTFFYPPLPYQNNTQGPGILAGAGAFNGSVCIDVNGVCTPNDPNPGYGRYPVLSPPSGPDIRDAQIAAFVDDVHRESTIYLYAVHNHNPAGALPDGRTSDITIARAGLNGGSGPLAFQKWNGQPCDTTMSCWSSAPTGQLVNDLPEYPILPDGSFQSCGDSSQFRSSPSISYVGETHQYLLTFVCKSPLGDPRLGPNQVGALPGGAWFFATSSDLSDPNQWSLPENAPREIVGSWNAFVLEASDFYNGWYPTFMSLGQQPGRLTKSGYVFYLWGCEGGECGGRQFTSRRFSIQTTDDVYSRPPVARFTGSVPSIVHKSIVLFTFTSNEPGLTFACSLNGASFSPCGSPDFVMLTPGTNELRVKAIDPFGVEGPAARVTVTYEPFVIGGAGSSR